MTEIDTFRLRFQCRSCGHEWASQYEVRSRRHAGGSSTIAYYRGGVPVTSPFAGVRCGGVRSICVDTELITPARNPGVR